MADNKKANPYQDVINTAAAKYGIDPLYLTKLIQVESGFDPNAKSPTGPRGLGQFTKATGAKYGLVKDEDFYNPNKSIDAAAWHIKDLLASNNNDYVKAGLAYNQGEGTGGKPQLDAYDTGDYSMISNEGQNYIRNFKEWDNGSNDKRTEFLNTPKQKVINGDSRSIYGAGDNTTIQPVEPVTALTGDTKNEIKSDPFNMPAQASLRLTPVTEIPQIANNYEADMFNQTGKTVQEVEDPTLWQRTVNAGDTIADYASKSVANGIYRAINYSPEGTLNYLDDRFRFAATNSYTPDNDDFAYARSKGVSANNYSMLEGASSKDGWKFAVDEAVRLQSVHQKIDDSNSTTGHILGFATDILLDPISYIPIAGVIGRSMKGVKLANNMLVRASEGVGYSVASSAAHNAFGGVEAHYGTATVFGAALGAGFGIIENRFINKSVNKAISLKSGQEDAAQKVADTFSDNAISTGQRIEARESAATLNGQRMDVLPPDPNTSPAFVSNGNSFWNHPYDKDAVVMADGTVIDGGNALNPKTMMNVRELMNGRIPENVPAGATSKPVENSTTNVAPQPTKATSGDIVENAVNGLDATGNKVVNDVVHEPTLVEQLSTKTDTPKAFYINLSNFTEIGNSMIGSNDTFVRNLGSKLFRPSMDTSGARGSFDLTSSDIIQRLKGTDNLFYSKYTDLESAALNDIKYSTFTKTERMELLNRNVVEAIEDASNTKLSKLTEAERNYAEHIRNNFIYKEDLAVNPSQLGSIDAIPLLESKSFNSGNYTPRYYNQSKIMDLKEKLVAMGVKEEDVATVAKDFVKHSFRKSYLSDAARRSEIDQRILAKVGGNKAKRLTQPLTTDYATKAEYDVAKKAFDDQQTLLKAGVEEYLEKLSYGVTNGGEDNIGGIVANLFGHGDGAVSARGANFLKERSPLGTDEVVMLPDGSAFSVNDIRDFSLRTIIPSYNSTMSHKLAIHGVGFTDDTLRSAVNENLARLLKTGDKRGAEALENGYKIITGQQRRNTMEGVLDNFLAAAQTATFGSRNTYFGAMTVTEVNNMIVQGSWRSMLDNIPLLRDAFAYNTKAGRETLEELHNLTFGSYLDDSIRPTYRNRVDAINASPNATTNQFAVKAAAGTRIVADNFAHYNPFTYALRETTNGVINITRKTVISDIVRNVFDGGKMPKYLRNEQKLNGLSVSNDQFNSIKELMKEHIEFKGKGNYSLKDQQAWVSDPRTAILHRLAENYADRVILRPETISSAQTKLFPRSMNMITQFKMFSVRSINGRMMQLYGDSKFNRQYMDNAMEMTLGFFTAGIGYLGQSYGQSKTMPEEQRDAYLSQALSSSNLSWNIVSRSNVIGGPIGLASTAYTIATGSGPGQFLRSSVAPSITDKNDPATFKGAMSQNPAFTGAAGRFVQQMPALSFTANLLAAPYYTARMLGSDEYTYDRSDYATAAFSNWRGVLPNNPLTYLFLDQIFRTQGIDTEYLRK
ncbi:transglycosylase SLT domain-containing protein [Yersinia enterocolitica]|uniref:transglycosylase SLT domain-containing protein n=1 Tax=Yersinia enterocolitica TaxID=630 RepID=UPI00330D3FB6|nr:transglycosylase SLT domain-containing protein [Yersinia enterocolitica]